MASLTNVPKAAPRPKIGIVRFLVNDSPTWLKILPVALNLSKPVLALSNSLTADLIPLSSNCVRIGIIIAIT
jgi:hypothetical protein